MRVYLARDITPFVMYCIYGESSSSLLIQSTNSMIIIIHGKTKDNAKMNLEEVYNMCIVYVTIAVH